MLTWELVGAVVGAGLASGREIAAFFARYGAWSYAGITLSAAALVILADNPLPSAWRGRWFERLWRWMLSLLLVATGGAMLSGAGEIAALTLPLHGAYWLGMAGTFALAWLLANRTAAGLAWVSRCLLGALALMILLGFFQPPRRAVALEPRAIPEAILRALAYGGFNAALAAPILSNAQVEKSARTRAVWQAGLVILLLLLTGNAVLQRHPALLSEPMPFLQMMRSYGRFGYATGSLALYLAVLSTLTACLRGLGSSFPSLVGIAAISLFGFSGVVETGYSLLGAGCLLLLAAAKFLNCPLSPFHSGRDVV